ncbi:MAG: hypothetical protein NC331_03090 [Lachnospiraceae bacterium]|nr:hypothetical protein [Lachnospiraceae bacterium]MCM1238351.1 hypothetical protein [Lachnospiraceae bacterium]
MKNIIIKIMAAFALFFIGVAVGVSACRVHDRIRPAAETAMSDPLEDGSQSGNVDDDIADSGLQLRVYGGDLEWYDGVRWNHAGKIDAYMEADPIVCPSGEWQTVADRLAETRAVEYAEELASWGRNGTGLLVGEIVTARPQTAAVIRPAAPAAAETTVSASAAPVNDVPDNDDNDDDDDDDGGTPVSEPEPEPEPEPDDTGDGEDMVWSGDYE